MTLHVALWEPEIAPNTGNVGRLCVATGTPLHLVGRLGFRLHERSLRRAGLDYWEHVDLRRHVTLHELFRAMPDSRVVCFSARARRNYTEMRFRDGDCLLFGSESRGLPAEVLQHHADTAVTIPIPTGKVRSLNLATAVGVGLYEALRQLNNW
jgi:tRNA (cytidine/uridine-2'-O-)-methyltransferase